MRLQFNDGQEILDSDLNAMGALRDREVFDRVLYQLTQKSQNGFFNDSFFVDYVDATHVSVRAGLGTQYDAAQVAPEPSNRGISADAAQSLTLAAANVSNPRIDLIVVKSARITYQSQTRNVKDYTTQNVAAQTLVTQTRWSNTLLVVQGTAAGSPAAPAVPAGYVTLAQILVSASTGVANQAAITDTRSMVAFGDQAAIDTSAFLSVAHKAAGTRLKTVLGDLDSQQATNTANIVKNTAQIRGVYDAIVGSTAQVTAGSATHSDLATAIAAVSAGASILVLSSLALAATVTINKTLELDFKAGVVVSNSGAGTGLSVTADGCRIIAGKFTGFTTAISVDSTTGTACLIRDARFTTNTTDISDAGQNVTSYGIINA